MSDDADWLCGLLTEADTKNKRLRALNAKMLKALQQIHYYETCRDPNRGELFLGALKAVEAAIAEATSEA